MEKAKRLKILAASDTHGDSVLLEKLASRAKKENVDLIILCGDIIGFFPKNNVIKPLKKADKPILLLHGNHEAPEIIDFLSNLYNVKNIHGTYAFYNGVAIFGAGGATPSLDFSESGILSVLDKAHSKVSNFKKKIMVTHMHPRYSKSEFSGFQGSAAILKAIKKFQPDLLIHGHIHEASGLEEIMDKTRVINVARKGTIIEI